MLNLKKTAVAVLALGSSAVFAGTMGPVCSAVNVTVPCESTAWEFGAKALYMQPSLGGTAAGTEGTFTGVNGNSVNFGRNPQYAWGFMIEGAYYFNTGNDLNINWYHINHSNSRTIAAGGGFTNSLGGLFSTTTTTAESTVSVDPHWDAVNIEVGQHVDFGENKSIRFHGGAEYARLTGNSQFAGTSTTTGTVFSAIAISETATTVLTNNPSYNGFGPRLGADMAYDWGNGLGIYANGAAGLLAGSAKYTRTLAVGTGAVATTGGTWSGSSMVVVPELEGKLGVTYTYAMAQGDLTLDAGWMWINYFNATPAVVGSNGDFGLQGLMFGLKWMGNVA